MTLPDVHLDDRDFQALVNEARERIGESCPEWTDHNVSDPGITLIEQFAWMTDMLLYRVNRIPEKVHLELLKLLGVQRRPPEAASADVLFRLHAPASVPVTIEAGVTQVAAPADPPRDPPVFVATGDVTIPSLRLETVVMTRDGVAREVPVIDGVASSERLLRTAFTAPPLREEALLLGFRDPLASLVVVLDVEARPAQGAGVRPDDPPWEWEVLAGDRQWRPVTVLRDETGGFNYGSGTVELELPPDATEMSIGGRTLHWLRCRLLPSAAGSPSYARAPEVERVRAGAVGALVRMEHAAVQEDEVLGHSDGTPGQAFHVRNTPALPLRPGEGLESWDHEEHRWVPWEERESFDESGRTDRHFAFDPVSGRVDLGPSVRVRGGWRQFGAVPPEGATLRMARYRYGEGVAGSVPAGALSVLRTPVAGVASVTNPRPAREGARAETMHEARTRVAAQLATRHRAVTVDDVQHLAADASAQVGRVRCGRAEPGRALPVRIVPTVAGATSRYLEAEELRPSDALLEHVARYLDQRRILGTALHVTPVALQGVTVAVRVRVAAHADPAKVQQAVDDELYGFLNPLSGGEDGTRWPFGRPLTAADVEVRVRRVPGVAAVDLLRLYESDLATGVVHQQPVDGLQPAPDELIASGRHVVRTVGVEAGRAA